MCLSFSSICSLKLCASGSQYEGEGDQNRPPPNMPLWHEEYFELRAIKKQQTQEELFALPHLPKRRKSISLYEGVPPPSSILREQPLSPETESQNRDGSAQKKLLKNPLSSISFFHVYTFPQFPMPGCPTLCLLSCHFFTICRPQVQNLTEQQKRFFAPQQGQGSGIGDTADAF